MNSRLRSSSPILLAILIALTFVAFGIHDGVPALRHDWSLPTTQQGWEAFGQAVSSGWESEGIGSAHPYPTLFLLGPILSGIALVFGPVTALAAFLLAIACSFLVAGFRMGSAVANRPWLGLPIAVLMLFNSWTYEKLVAGHLTMILSTAMCMLIAAELLQKTPRRTVLLVCSYVAAFQIQFAFLVLFATLVVRPTRRNLGWTFAGATISLLPAVVGILLSRSALAGIPYTFSWQFANSLPTLDAFLLDGYSPRYTDGSYSIFQAATWLLIVNVVLGLLLSLWKADQRNRAFRLVIGSLLLIFYATGLRGPFAQIYAASLNIRETLVFRELFDLIGIVALFYVIAATVAAARSKFCAAGLSLAAAVMLAGWFISPPWHWWVPSASLPRLAVYTSTPNQRFALFPWRQPLMFEGAGSGADPDVYARANNVVPINQYEDEYPADVALSTFERSGDARDLEALSVARVYSRPYFSTNLELIKRALPIDDSKRRISGDSKLNSLPELALIDIPPDRDTPAAIHDLYLFNGGAPTVDAKYLRQVQPPLQTTDPKSGWVYAPLVFAKYPEIGNALGGAFTTSRVALNVPIGDISEALVSLHGRLLSGHEPIAESTRTQWKWVALHGASKLTCDGACTILAWREQPYTVLSMHESKSADVVEPIAFHQFLPYLIYGELPAQRITHAKILLFRTRFDPSWHLIGPPTARHLEVSSLFNGYELSGTLAVPTAFFLIEETAAVQTIAMIGSVLLLALLIWLTSRNTSTGDSEA